MVVQIVFISNKLIQILVFIPKLQSLQMSQYPPRLSLNDLSQFKYKKMSKWSLNRKQKSYQSEYLKAIITNDKFSKQSIIFDRILKYDLLETFLNHETIDYFFGEYLPQFCSKIIADPLKLQELKTEIGDFLVSVIIKFFEYVYKYPNFMKAFDFIFDVVKIGNSQLQTKVILFFQHECSKNFKNIYELFVTKIFKTENLSYKISKLQIFADLCRQFSQQMAVKQILDAFQCVLFSNKHQKSEVKQLANEYFSRGFIKIRQNQVQSKSRIRNIVKQINNSKTLISAALLNKIIKPSTYNRNGCKLTVQYLFQIKIDKQILQVFRGNLCQFKQKQCVEDLFVLINNLIESTELEDLQIDFVLQLYQILISKEYQLLINQFYQMLILILGSKIICSEGKINLSSIILKGMMAEKIEDISDLKLKLIVLMFEINNLSILDSENILNREFNQYLLNIIYNVDKKEVLKRAIQHYSIKCRQIENISSFNKIFQCVLKDLFSFYLLKQNQKVTRVLKLIDAITETLIKHDLIRVMNLSMYRKGQILNLKFVQKYTNNKTLMQNISIKSNSTVFDLKCELARILRITWKDIVIKTCQQTNKNNLSMILKDSGIYIKETNEYSINILEPKYKFIENDKLSKQATQAFTTIFNRHSTNGRMSREQCVSFVKVALNQLEYSGVDHVESKLFSEYNHNQEQFLIAHDILSFFESCSLRQGQERFVWKNLQNFGFRRDFKEKDCPDCQIPVFQKFPLHPLGSNEQLSKLLLDLIENKQTHSLAWNLLQALPIHKSVYDYLLHSDVTQILTLQSPHRLFYYLHVICDLMHNNQSEQIQLKCKQKMLEQKVFFKLLSFIRDLFSQQCCFQIQIKEKILQLIIEIVQDQIFLQFKTLKGQKFENILKNHIQIDNVINQIKKKTNQPSIVKQDIDNNITNEQRIITETYQSVLLASITELLKQTTQFGSQYKKVLRDLLRFLVALIFYSQDCSKLVQALPKFIFYANNAYFNKILELVCCLIDSQLFSATQIMVPAFIHYIEEHLDSNQHRLPNSFCAVLKLVDTEININLPAQSQQILASAILKSSDQQVTKSCALILSKTKYETSFNYFDQIWKQFSNSQNTLWSVQTRQYILKFITKVIRQNPNLGQKLIHTFQQQFIIFKKKFLKNHQIVEERNKLNCIYQMMLDQNLPLCSQFNDPKFLFLIKTKTICSFCKHERFGQTRPQVLDLTGVSQECVSIQECVQYYLQPTQTQCSQCHQMCEITKSIQECSQQLIVRPNKWQYTQLLDFLEANQQFSLDIKSFGVKKFKNKVKSSHKSTFRNRKCKLSLIVSCQAKQQQSKEQNKYFYVQQKSDKKGKKSGNWLYWDSTQLKELDRDSIDQNNATVKTIKDISKRIIFLVYCISQTYQKCNWHFTKNKDPKIISTCRQQNKQILYFQQLIILFKETQQHSKIMSQYSVSLLDHCLRILCLTKNSDNKEKILRHINQIIQQSSNDSLGQQIISKYQFRKLHEVENDNGKSLNEIFFSIFKPLFSTKSLNNDNNTYPEYILQFLMFKNQLLKKKQDQICLYLGQSQAEFWAELLNTDIALAQHILGDRILQIFMAFLLQANNSHSQYPEFKSFPQFNQTQQKVQRATIKLLKYLNTHKNEDILSPSQIILKHRKYLQSIYLNNFQLSLYIIQNYFHNNLQHSAYFVSVLAKFKQEPQQSISKDIYKIVSCYFNIQDDYQLNRFSLLFGEPSLNFDQKTVLCCKNKENNYFCYYSPYWKQKDYSFFKLFQKLLNKQDMTKLGYLLFNIVYNNVKIKNYLMKLPPISQKFTSLYEDFNHPVLHYSKQKKRFEQYQRMQTFIQIKSPILDKLFQYYNFQNHKQLSIYQEKETTTETQYEICKQCVEQSQQNYIKQYQSLEEKLIKYQKIQTVNPPDIDSETPDFIHYLQSYKQQKIHLVKFQFLKKQIDVRINKEIKMSNYEADIVLFQSHIPRLSKEDINRIMLDNDLQKGKFIYHNLRGLLLQNESRDDYRVYYKQGMRYLKRSSKLFIDATEIESIKKDEDI